MAEPITFNQTIATIILLLTFGAALGKAIWSAWHLCYWLQQHAPSQRRQERLREQALRKHRRRQHRQAKRFKQSLEGLGGQLHLPYKAKRAKRYRQF